ncbi:hypothetical protein [Novipirellula caenicola]|uniref:Uncharacterized protein n=1 Tax=Novipirellula caenicola TaxID=1536901 RepID=A0ABP9VQA6_9BACT
MKKGGNLAALNDPGASKLKLQAFPAIHCILHLATMSPTTASTAKGWVAEASLLP